MAKSEKPEETTEQTVDAAGTVRRLVEIVVEHNLAQLDVEMDGVRINIKGASAPAAPIAPVYTAPIAHMAAAKPVAESGPDKRIGLIALELPMMGTFYRAPTPTDPPFINVGDTVRIGQTICQIEAMKTFSDVPSESAGKVVEIVVENGKIVNFGDTLMYLEPL